MKSMVARTPRSVRTRKPFSSIGAKLALRWSTVGQIETASSTPSSRSSWIMPSGSGQYRGSKCQSPWVGQWKKSATTTESGRPRRWYSRAIESSSSCDPYRSLHCQKPMAKSGIMGTVPVAAA